MKDITNNEMNFVLNLLKNPKEELNARNMAKRIGITHMGSFKIAKKLEKEEIVDSRQIGKGNYYKLNLNKEYVRQYVLFLLSRESEQSNPSIKRWVNELKNITKAEIIILFGSVLTKHEGAKDIDVLLVTNDRKFHTLKKEIESINLVNQIKIHPLYQSREDFERNVKIGDKVILSAIKGIVIFGGNSFLEAIER